MCPRGNVPKYCWKLFIYWLIKYTTNYYITSVFPSSFCAISMLKKSKLHTLYKIRLFAHTRVMSVCTMWSWHPLLHTIMIRFRTVDHPEGVIGKWMSDSNRDVVHGLLASTCSLKIQINLLQTLRKTTIPKFLLKIYKTILKLQYQT